jgi:hypothetical protein
VSFGENAELVKKALEVLKIIDEDIVDHYATAGAKINSGAGAFRSAESQETSDDEALSP